MTGTGDQVFRTVYKQRGRYVHVEEGSGTFGKRDAPGVPRLLVEIRDENGNVVFHTWQNGPLEAWDRATLYFDRVALDHEGREIGFSLWG